ncbi:MAG: dTDP-4-dehydrorhamnose reductase [bacterium]|nr:dTDP-4-dehydrorhamnose reductase [bacterium]
MRLLVTGCKGQLGQAIMNLASERGYCATGHDIDTLDITSRDGVAAAVAEAKPASVINCAALTAVDDCETHEDAALDVNARAVAHLVSACASSDASLVHVSTDYVFSGDSARPYTESDPVGPASAYGRTKLAGEREAESLERHLIVRTAWLYGHGGSNFVEAIKRQINSGNLDLRVVSDQIGSPTSCDDLAGALLDLADSSATGIVHAVNSGVVSWHGFAQEIVRLLGSEAVVHPVSTDEFPRPARRPMYSVLDTSRLSQLLGKPLQPWQDALAQYLEHE